MKPGDVVYLIMRDGEIVHINTTFDAANRNMQALREYWENGPLQVRAFSDGTFQVIENGAIHHVLHYYYVITKPLED